MKKKLEMFFVMVLLLAFPILVVRADDLEPGYSLELRCADTTLSPQQYTTCTIVVSANTSARVIGFDADVLVTEDDGTTESQKLVLSNFSFDENTWDGDFNSTSNNSLMLTKSDESNPLTGMIEVATFQITAGHSLGTVKVNLKNVIVGHQPADENESSITLTGPDSVQTTITISTQDNDTNNNPSTSSDIKKEYNLSVGNDYSITFEDVIGKEFELVVTPYTDHIKKYEQNKETLEQTRDAIKDMVKDYGDYIEWYEIIVKETNTRKTDGTFTFRIKMTDEMKKYKEFKMINVETTDDKIEKADVVKMKVDGDYLVAELPHLSHYALVGKTIDNPGTGVTISLLGIGVLLAGAVSYVALRKKNYFNKI